MVQIKPVALWLGGWFDPKLGVRCDLLFAHAFWRAFSIANDGSERRIAPKAPFVLKRDLYSEI
jgi:hypothetical protein